MSWNLGCGSRRAALLATVALTAAAPAGDAVRGRYVRVESGERLEYLHFAEVEVYVGGRNIAVGRPTTASSTMQPFTPDKAVDGVIEYVWGVNPSFWSSGGSKGGEWWEVDLGEEAAIERLLLYNRLDCCQERLQGALLRVLSATRSEVFRRVLDAGTNPTEIEFVVREVPDVNLNATPLPARLAEIAPRFTAPQADPAYVMPVGSGDLSAMLRYGDAWELHLSKSDFFAIEKQPYHSSPTLHSPGHVQLSFGLPGAALTRFEQRLDLGRGAVVLTLESAAGRVTAEAYGVMGRNALIVAVEDTRPERVATITLSSWRPTLTVSSTAGLLVAREVHDYDERGQPVADPAAVSPTDRMYKLGVATVVACAEENGQLATAVEPAGASAGTLRLAPPARYWLVIAAATSYDGAPEAAAGRLAQALVTTAKQALSAARLEWWSHFWQAAYVDLYGRDAETLMRLWYTGLYSYASVANAVVLPKFNGGPGLVRGDERSWGWGYWWQNTRELVWPLFAANQLRYARDYLDFYDRQFMDCRRGTARAGKLGIRMWESATPFKPGTVSPAREVSGFSSEALEKAMADTGMETVKSGYNARSLAQAVELVQLMFDYVAFSGDQEYLKTAVAPWLREAALFYLSYLRRGADGLYHSTVSDAIEMWWKVKDPLTDLAAVRYCFANVLNYGDEFGYEPEFLAAVRDRLEHLAPLPTGIWHRRTAAKEELPPGTPAYTTQIVDRIEPTDACYAPAAELYDDRLVHNMENPELYLVFPLALVDANSPPADLERAVNTFRQRLHPNAGGWSQCGIQAARLRLPDAVNVIMEHVRKHQRYPYGGWNSPGKNLADSKLGIADVPYFDAMGVNLTALQEALLQSHCLSTSARSDPPGSGPIVLVPAVRQDWAGRFRLRARGGFLVSTEFQAKRRVVKVTVEAERGGLLRLVNPFPECRVTQGGAELRVSREPLLAVTTQAGDTFVFTATDAPNATP
jgi:hypothetical protein